MKKDRIIPVLRGVDIAESWIYYDISRFIDRDYQEIFPRSSSDSHTFSWEAKC
jgi:hypothetical protein